MKRKKCGKFLKILQWTKVSKNIIIENLIDEGQI